MSAVPTSSPLGYSPARADETSAYLPNWQCCVILEIANFDALRRQVGCPRADVVAGDVANRVRESLPDARIIVAGRRHVEVLFDGSTAAVLDSVAAVLAETCAQPFEIDGEWHDIVIILGSAAVPAEGADFILLAERTERALLAARSSDTVDRRSRGDPAAINAFNLVRELRRAIDQDELFLQYQPKFNVRRQDITSAEGLIRWNHPTQGVILPGEFIAAAEQSRLIGAMTLWTIKRAIADQRILAARGHDLRLFINISGHLLGDAGFVRAACDLVGENDAKLGFEITETSVIDDPDSAIGNLQMFADYGIVIAIDDYGAGLSSLAYLKQLPARELKIDKLFVTHLASSNRDPLIVRSTIDLAHALEMEVVAEGVETHAAMALLSVMGCDMIQGFLISRPIGIDALCVFLSEDRPVKSARPNFFGLRQLAT